MSPEKYQPSPEEIKQAEEMMTDEQRERSERRESFMTIPGADVIDGNLRCYMNINDGLINRTTIDLHEEKMGEEDIKVAKGYYKKNGAESRVDIPGEPFRFDSGQMLYYTDSYGLGTMKTVLNSGLSVFSRVRDPIHGTAKTITVEALRADGKPDEKAAELWFEMERARNKHRLRPITNPYNTDGIKQLQGDTLKTCWVKQKNQTDGDVPLQLLKEDIRKDKEGRPYMAGYSGYNSPIYVEVIDEPESWREYLQKRETYEKYLEEVLKAKE